MYDGYISSPRPLFGDKATIDGRTKRKRLEVGSKSAGVVIDITAEGLYFNGWYLGFNNDTKFASTSEPGFISWENLEKAKKLLEKSPANKTKERKKRGKKKKLEEEIVEIEDEVTEDYLRDLPIVTLAGRQFYIDADKRERREVNNPNKAVKF
jgi:hypothetical protein